MWRRADTIGIFMTPDAATDLPAEPRVRALHDPTLYTNRELSWLERIGLTCWLAITIAALAGRRRLA
jgi:hypothetical protein